MGVAAVSIHAPVKGRHRIAAQAKDMDSFNPRPREGATCSRAVIPF
ncbi:hypothetical protein DWUX_1349 [Desulfovibrio diazotrophicus]|nr:hypothetical protein DWUX_1349 [Desulfovibrio diazotrophicus]